MIESPALDYHYFDVFVLFILCQQGLYRDLQVLIMQITSIDPAASVYEDIARQLCDIVCCSGGSGATTQIR